MKRLKKVAFALAVVFAVIQFIQPAHNKSVQVLPTDFTVMYKMPDTVKSIVQNACYDCHSNNTVYTWYSNIQPIAWLMASHIKNGKAKLNFSEFGNLSKRRQASTLNNISNQIKDDEMPLSSYKLMHPKARLSKEEKTMLTNWLQATADSISNK